MDLRKQILAAYNAADAAERKRILSEVDAARHEIRAARLEQEPVLRELVRQMWIELSKIEGGAVAHGGFTGTHYAMCVEIGADGRGFEPSAIIRIAGQIEVQLAMRCVHLRRAGDEQRGGWHHARRIQDAAEAARSDDVDPLVVNGGTSGETCRPIDKRSITCAICGAPKGEPCRFVRVAP